MQPQMSCWDYYLIVHDQCVFTLYENKNVVAFDKPFEILNLYNFQFKLSRNFVFTKGCKYISSPSIIVALQLFVHCQGVINIK